MVQDPLPELVGRLLCFGADHCLVDCGNHGPPHPEGDPEEAPPVQEAEVPGPRHLLLGLLLLRGPAGPHHLDQVRLPPLPGGARAAHQPLQLLRDQGPPRRQRAHVPKSLPPEPPRPDRGARGLLHGPRALRVPRCRGLPRQAPEVCHRGHGPLRPHRLPAVPLPARARDHRSCLRALLRPPEPPEGPPEAAPLRPGRAAEEEQFGQLQERVPGPGGEGPEGLRLAPRAQADHLLHGRGAGRRVSAGVEVLPGRGG
mmetsp:Transcript_1335/g.3836  ORF Transcript_1335/g.3836 Transcript_1335/m.3836 type:complete len:256 (-) Transcript_1335:134-901(-)